MKNLIKFGPLLFIVFFFCGCTRKSEPKITPEKYDEQGILMSNIADKLSEEQDGKQLNTAARGIESSRVVSCVAVVEECAVYGKFLSKAIQLSADGTVTAEERKELNELNASLKSEIRKGLAILQNPKPK